MRIGKIGLLVSVLAVFIMLSPLATGQGTGVIATNAQGDIVLDKPAIVGQVTLPPGRYYVHSRGTGPHQEVHFVKQVMLSTVHPESSDMILYNEVGRVSCDTQPCEVKAVTALHYVIDDSGTMRIVSADIKGESHSHIF